MSRQLEDFFPHFRASATGCPALLAEREILFAARTFCEQTWCWQHEDELVLSSGEDEYTLSEELYLPSQSEIVGLVSAEDENESDYTDKFSLDLDSGVWTEEDEPTSSATITVKVALRPTRAASTLPDFLYNSHIDSIGAGSLSRLLMQPGTDWFNPKLAQYYERKFQAAIAAVRRRRNKGHSKKSLTVRMRTFM